MLLFDVMKELQESDSFFIHKWPSKNPKEVITVEIWGATDDKKTTFTTKMRGQGETIVEAYENAKNTKPQRKPVVSLDEEAPTMRIL